MHDKMLGKEKGSQPKQETRGSGKNRNTWQVERRGKKRINAW